MPEAILTRKFSAAHRLADDPGVCSRIHGHNYVAEVKVSSNVLGPGGLFVVPADDVKEVVDRKYDHRLILQEGDPVQVVVNDGSADAEWVIRIPLPPSTENLAWIIAEEVCEVTWKYLGGNSSMELSLVEVEVVLRETDTIAAHAFAFRSNNP